MKVRVAIKQNAIKVGGRLRVTGVAPSISEERGYVNDKERLLGQTGTVEGLGDTQLRVVWDHDKPGSLMLAGEDEIEILEDT